jgi:hypothetical protein
MILLLVALYVSVSIITFILLIREDSSNPILSLLLALYSWMAWICLLILWVLRVVKFSDIIKIFKSNEKTDNMGV